MSFSWLLLILLLQSDSISSSFDGRLVTRPTLIRWSRSPVSCGINWLPLKRRYFPCFRRMSSNVQRSREEYDEIIEQMLTGTPPPQTTRSQEASRVVGPSHRMVGSYDSLRGEFPWSTSLERFVDNEWSRGCNAVFLLSNWVLTAAHCTYNTTYQNGSQIPMHEQEPLPANHLRIRYNADAQRYVDLNTTMVQKFFIHPGYNSSVGGRYNEFDISLMRLNERVLFEEIYRPEEPIVGQRRYYGANAICLPEVSWSVGSGNEDVYRFTSFGPYTYDKVIPEVARKQWVVPKEFVNINNNHYGLRTESRIGYAGCAGDSGSPMVVHNSDGRFFIAGVVRGGREWNSTARCGYVYMYLCQVTRDDPLNWIKETIANETGW